MKYVGKRVTRSDAHSKVSGEAIYGADFPGRGAYFVKVFRSPHAHAYLRGIDISKALAIKRVLAVLIAKDIPGENLSGKIRRDQPVLAEGKVRYVGEPIAAIVAETPTAGELALQEIKVEYDLLPSVGSPEEGLAEKAPIIHQDTNLMKEFHIRKGDVAEGFSKSYIIVENVYTTQWVEHAYLEPEAGFARMDSKGIIWVYAPTQFSHHIAKEISMLLSLPLERVRLVQTVIGGGFGGKIDMSVHGILALAAYRTKKPVRLIYTREESFQGSVKRHPFKMHYRTGADKKGRLLAVDVDILADTGAYASSGPAVISRAGIHCAGPYQVENVRARCRNVYTNNPVSGAMRGFGIPQVAFAYESQMDMLAIGLDMDPYKIREKNILIKGSQTITGHRLEHSVGVGSALREAYIAHKKNPIFISESERPHVKRGVGFACAHYGIGNTGQVNHCEAKITFTKKGKILVCVGASELGQGLQTVFHQIAADSFDLAWEDIEINTNDTHLTSDPGITSASKQTYMSGNAIHLASKKMIQEIKKRLAICLRTKKNAITYSGGQFGCLHNNNRMSLSLSEAASILFDSNMHTLTISAEFSSKATPLDPDTGHGQPYPTYSFACQIAEVEVDTRTGKTKVLRIISANDIGKAINPATSEGQIVGGAVMGVGYALFEEYKPGITKNFGEFLIPTTCDSPEVVPLIIEEEEPSGPYGAKGLGELVCIPTAAAIANAVSHAIGVRLTRLPLTSQEVYQALKTK